MMLIFGKINNMIPVLKALRIPNLIIIVLTQVLLRFYIIEPILKESGAMPALSLANFFILVLIFVLMAAAGYLINDFYDIEADRINKPKKALIGRDIITITAKIIYAVFNIIAIALGFYLALEVNYFQLGFVFVAIILMLWYYSARYKRMVFWGNLVVAVLLGFTVFAVWLFEFFALRNNYEDFIQVIKAIQKIQYFIWGFAWFAFITTLIREMIKDIEDIEGDRKVGYNTMPVALGIKNTRYVIAFVMFIALSTLIFVVYWLFMHNFTWAFWYLLITVITLMIYTLYKVLTAKEKKDWSFAGNLMKVIMVAGIISMQMIFFNL